jgi:hypothetical protein
MTCGWTGLGAVAEWLPNEIGMFADLVDLQVHRRLAAIAATCNEPVDQFVAAGAGCDGTPPLRMARVQSGRARARKGQPARPAHPTWFWQPALWARGSEVVTISGPPRLLSRPSIAD